MPARGAFQATLAALPKVLPASLDGGVACAARNDTGALQWSAPMFRIVQ